MCRYPPSIIHRYLDLPSTQRIQTHTSHRHNTTPPLPTLVQAPYPLPSYTTHTTATKTQTHVQHSPCLQRIGKAQTQFSHPLTPHSTHTAYTHIHMSHTPPTTLTITSPVLDKTSEPRVPLIHALTQCAPKGCTRQEVGSLHSLETTSHSLQQTYLRLLIHTT